MRIFVCKDFSANIYEYRSIRWGFVASHATVRLIANACNLDDFTATDDHGRISETAPPEEDLFSTMPNMISGGWVSRLPLRGNWLEIKYKAIWPGKPGGIVSLVGNGKPCHVRINYSSVFSGHFTCLGFKSSQSGAGPDPIRVTPDAVGALLHRERRTDPNSEYTFSWFIK